MYINLHFPTGTFGGQYKDIKYVITSSAYKPDLFSWKHIHNSSYASIIYLQHKNAESIVITCLIQMILKEYNYYGNV